MACRVTVQRSAGIANSGTATLPEGRERQSQRHKEGGDELRALARAHSPEAFGKLVELLQSSDEREL